MLKCGIDELQRARESFSVTSPLPRRLVAFDLDGTLIDSRGDIAHAANRALGDQGFIAKPAEEIAKMVGDGGRALCARAAGISVKDERVEPLFQCFLEHYVQSPAERTHILPGAAQALHLLRGQAHVVLALCTNKPRRTTDAVLNALGLADYFHFSVAGGDTEESKPAAAPLLKLMREASVEADATMLVGDGPQDVSCARAAQAVDVCVHSPFPVTPRALALRPTHVLESLEALPGLLTRLGWLG